MRLRSASEELQRLVHAIYAYGYASCYACTCSDKDITGNRSMPTRGHKVSLPLDISRISTILARYKSLTEARSLSIIVHHR